MYICFINIKEDTIFFEKTPPWNFFNFSPTIVYMYIVQYIRQHSQSSNMQAFSFSNDQHKGCVSRDFWALFFHDLNPSGPLTNRLNHFRIFFRFRRDIQIFKKRRGVYHTAVKLLGVHHTAESKYKSHRIIDDRIEKSIKGRRCRIGTFLFCHL